MTTVLLVLLALNIIFSHLVDGFTVHTSHTSLCSRHPRQRPNPALPLPRRTSIIQPCPPGSNWALRVSELHIPGYRETKKHFLSEDIDTKGHRQQLAITHADYSSLLPYRDGHLIHKTNGAFFTDEECRGMVEEAENVASQMGWTTTRHGNYPTTDIPIVQLPNTLNLLRSSLQSRLYPLLRHQFSTYLPDPTKLRVADGFIVKYDANGGQSELRPHRDGSVLSFNIALNDSTDYEGGGTWFHSLGESIRIEKGEVVSHASGILHGGHGITSGRRYIMVCFVILEGYDTWSMRFYNDVRDL
ncbi:hypothetical protein ACHAW6_002208 [Cyclotella cf. meneghiniana]